MSPKTSVSRPTGDSNLILDQWKFRQDNLAAHPRPHTPSSIPSPGPLTLSSRLQATLKVDRKLSMRGWEPSLPLVQRPAWHG